MVSPAGSVPYSYMNILNPPKPKPVAPAGTPAPKVNLFPKDTVELSQEVVDLLIAFAPGSDANSSLSSLFGVKGSSAVLNDVYSNLIAVAYQGAAQKKAQTATPSDSLSKLLASYNAAMSGAPLPSQTIIT